MTRLLRWLRSFWDVPAVGRTHDMHVEDTKLQAWTMRKLGEFHDRLDALEAKVDTLIKDVLGD